jgi:hypothetical protein
VLKLTMVVRIEKQDRERMLIRASLRYHWEARSLEEASR